MACPTPSETAIENNGEIRHLSNRFAGAENENPGALAGATGAISKASQLLSEQYTDAPTAARRVDQNGNWNRARWGWLDAVTADGNLSPTARLLAHVLVTKFSNHETAYCAPGTDTLAEKLSTTVATINRALRDLAAAGWLIRTEGRGRGRRSRPEIFFLGVSNVVPFIVPKGPEATARDRQKGSETPARGAARECNSARSESERIERKGADMRRESAKSAQSYNKADPKNNQRAGGRGKTSVASPPSGRPDYSTYDRATAPETWSGVLFTIKRGGNAEAAWNDWLTSHGFPTLAEIGPGSGADGWAVPCTLPPRPDGDRFEVSRAEKWARIFSHKTKGVAYV